MPYIVPKRREEYDGLIIEIAKKVAKLNVDNCTSLCGDWNYVITKLIKETLHYENCEINYKTHNEVVGMLECCKLEYFRRNVALYEDGKIEQNGDV